MGLRVRTCGKGIGTLSRPPRTTSTSISCLICVLRNSDVCGRESLSRLSSWCQNASFR